jgi:lipoprotein-anchoring transpeptidase ErfK/SrfK
MRVAITSLFVAGAGGAAAEPLALAPFSEGATDAIFAPSLREEEPAVPSDELPSHLRRQIVAYPSSHPAGTIVIDTAHTYLYLVLGGGRAMRYGIGVGRDGFTWSGVETISRMAEWPDWHPPAEMIRRQPYLPRFVAGGPGNPLGARAMYLGSSQYRIHGTNDPATIGRAVSSGCIRLTNEDVADLYARVRLGATVVVLPGSPTRTAERRAAVMPIAAVTR